MVIEAFISRRTGKVTIPGGEDLTAELLLRDTLELSLGFMNDLGQVEELPAGALGHIVLKKASDFTSQARLQKNSWTVSGSGTSRRYKFKLLVWSGLLQDDLVADLTTAYVLQIEYFISGDPRQVRGIPTKVVPTYIAPGEVPPPIPTAGYIRPWAREIFGPSEPVDDATRYVGHIDKGGPIKSLRLGMAAHSPGLSVMLKHNGVNLFTQPVVMSAETVLLTDVDDPSLFARLTVLDGARIDSVTVHNESEYDERGDGLQVEFGIFTNEVSLLEVEPAGSYQWLKATLPDVQWDDETQTGTMPASSGGTVFTLVDGALRFAIGGNSREIPSYPVA